jgi:hypothetical protein
VRRGLPVGLRTNVSTADPAVSLLIPPFPTTTSPPPAFFALPFLDAHAVLAEWLVEDAFGHAGFILSTQVAASILSNSCGFMQGTIYVDRFQNGILVSFDEMVAGATALLSDPHAGQTGPNDPYQELREMMLMCTNEFGTINNSGDLGEPQTVYGPSGAPRSFRFPY